MPDRGLAYAIAEPDRVVEDWAEIPSLKLLHRHMAEPIDRPAANEWSRRLRGRFHRCWFCGRRIDWSARSVSAAQYPVCRIRFDEACVSSAMLRYRPQHAMTKTLRVGWNRTGSTNLSRVLTQLKHSQIGQELQIEFETEEGAAASVPPDIRITIPSFGTGGLLLEQRTKGQISKVKGNTKYALLVVTELPDGTPFELSTLLAHFKAYTETVLAHVADALKNV